MPATQHTYADELFLKKLNTYTEEKKTHPINIWANKLNRRLSKEDMKMASETLKKCSQTFITREMQRQILSGSLTSVK